MEQFAQTFKKEFGSLQSGECHREVGSSGWHYAPHCFGYLRKRSSKSHDWFEAKSTVITSVMEAKRAALAENKRTTSERSLYTCILRIAKSKT